MIADQYYGDSSLDWIVYLTNNITDPQWEWPLPQEVFDDFIRSKYGSIPIPGSETNLDGDTLRSEASVEKENLTTQLREDLGCKIILGGKGQSAFERVKELLKNGHHICLLSDRHVGKSGVGVEFFNQMAAFPKGPVSLSLDTQLPIVPAAFIKNGNKYQLHFGKPFIVPYFENQAQSIQHGLKVLSKSFENLIKLDPNQWHSIQPVWTSEY